jgi:hypothetical protein
MYTLPANYTGNSVVEASSLDAKGTVVGAEPGKCIASVLIELNSY